MAREERVIEMTTGSLWKNILLFSLPLMLTQVLEVLFNLSDVAIAGKFADYRALGAVGSTTLLVSLFTGLLIGIGSGVNVAVARGLGLRDGEQVEKTVHTSFIICAAAGVIMLLICNLLARPMLALLNTKDELIDGATLYLKIYAFGMPAMALYNFGNGVLSATGDTKRPLIYLSLAGVLNVALNLFFVIKCHMAADGVALASVIAQWLSALLIVLHLLGRRDECRLEWRKLRFHPQAGRRVLAIGIPTGLQNAIFAIANLFVQVGVNSFDAVMVSGNSAAANADTLIFNMMAAFYTACATFGSRNWGAGNNDRILKSYRISMCYAAIVGGVAGGLLLLFGREFLSIFANEPEVIDAGKCGGNYGAANRAGERAEAKGYSQVLWLDGVERKYVEEGGGMNVMFKINGTVVTPALTGSILRGVTRKSAIELLKSWNMPVEERLLSVDELFEAARTGALEEAWCIGTAAVISPIGALGWGDVRYEVNGGRIGALSQKLYDELTGIQWGTRPDPFGWTCKVEA